MKKEDVKTAGGCLTTVLLFLLVDTAVLYVVVWLWRCIGQMIGWW